MKKKITAAVLAATLVLASVMPAYAAVTYTKTNSDGSIAVYTDNSDNINYPCWIWIDGYSYYYTNPGTIFKNTTTPDGYTVDAEGRWVINGVVQTNGYGNHSMNTSDYTGKSDDEIWNLMKAKLEPIFVNTPAMTDGEGATMYTSKNSIAFEIAHGAVVGNDTTIEHNNTYRGTYVTAIIGNAWSDEVDIYNAGAKTIYAAKAPLKEKVIKTVVGDQIGQELFNYIRAHADKTTSGYVDELDANGNIIRGYKTVDPSTISAELPFGDPNAPDVWIDDPNGPEWRRVWSETCGDGINAETLDLSAWQNRTTDYGKRFSVVYDNGLMIHVYN